MWLPETYGEVEDAVGVVAEGTGVDFKLAPTQPADLRDLAKDVAAMSIAGGVIVVGVDEVDGLATEIVPFPIANRVEQIQQVVDSRVDPAPSARIEALRRDPADSEGLIVITVAPSRQAPHMVGDRFPARSGATTRYYSEREVAELYRRRQQLREAASRAVGFDDFVAPADGERQPPQGIGRMRLRVRPSLPVSHPDEPHLRQTLSEAVRSAGTSLQSYIRPTESPAAFDWLVQWTPRGGTGWQAGQAATTGLAVPFHNKLVAGTYLYEDGFSFQAVIGLIPDAQQWWSAYEHLWVAETMALLSVAGQFYAGVPAASPLRCDLELVGLSNGVSYFASQGRSDDPRHPRVTDSSYTAGVETTARDLASDPRPATHGLLDRLLVSIIPEGVDLVDRLAP